MKILVAEDNAISQELLRKLLVNKGHDVIIAGDGRVAWDLLCQGLRPDLCILDIMMPVMSGLEVLQKIRHDDRFKTMKAIICSALRDREAIAQGAALGIEYYILKPFKPDLVMQQVERALQVRTQEAAVSGQTPPLNLDPFALARSITLLSDEIGRGSSVIRNALAGSPLSNGGATFHTQNEEQALSPHFQSIRSLVEQIDRENQQLRKKSPELPATAAMAM